MTTELTSQTSSSAEPATKVLSKVKRHALVEDFNPVSSQQVLSYLKHRGYDIPLDRKNRRPTTNKEAMKTLWLEYPEDHIIEGVEDARHIKKGIGDLKDNALGRDSRFHSIFTLVPDTGRLSAKRPNTMNLPQGREGGLESEIAQAIRSTIVADPGYVLFEFDWKAIEAVLTGWFAQDPGYIRLSLKDSHGVYTSHLMEKAWGHATVKAFDPFDPDLDGKLEWLKKNFPLERSRGKTANLALGYGMRPRHLAAKLRVHPSEAVKFIQVKDDMAPLVTKWKEQTRRRAHEEGKLTNPFGFTRAFFDIFRRDKNGIWRLSTDAEANECLAFLPQSTGAAMLRECLVSIDEELGDREDIQLLIPVHDSLFGQCLPSKLDEVREIFTRHMEREWKELDGLKIGVEMKTGLNWAEMKNA